MDRRFFLRRAAALPAIAALASIPVLVKGGDGVEVPSLTVPDAAIEQPERIPALEQILNWAATARASVKCPSCPDRVLGGFAPLTFKAAVRFEPNYDYQANETGFDVQVHALPDGSGHFGGNHLTEQEQLWVQAKAHDDLSRSLAALLAAIHQGR